MVLHTYNRSSQEDHEFKANLVYIGRLLQKRIREEIVGRKEEGEVGRGKRRRDERVNRERNKEGSTGGPCFRRLLGSPDYPEVWPRLAPEPQGNCGCSFWSLLPRSGGRRRSPLSQRGYSHTAHFLDNRSRKQRLCEATHRVPLAHIAASPEPQHESSEGRLGSYLMWSLCR